MFWPGQEEKCRRTNRRAGRSRRARPTHNRRTRGAAPSRAWHRCRPTRSRSSTTRTSQRSRRARSGRSRPWRTAAQYGYGQQQPGRGKLIALVVTLLVVLGGAGGFAAWYIVTHGQPDPGQTAAGPTDATPTSPGSGSPIQPQFPTTCKISSDEAAFDPCAVKVGDCLFNDGTAAEPDIRVIGCGVESSYKVLKVGRGPDIKEGPDDVFDKDTTSVAECKDTGYQHWYGYQDAFDDNKDVFLCLPQPLMPDPLTAGCLTSGRRSAGSGGVDPLVGAVGEDLVLPDRQARLDLVDQPGAERRTPRRGGRSRRRRRARRRRSSSSPTRWDTATAYTAGSLAISAATSASTAAALGWAS